ncbi:MAG: phosphate regulon sensor histidine kinase PhoR [Methylococcaceae bacterium]|jgi:two-component system phosphate regulon sensor histidine kinase PhoR
MLNPWRSELSLMFLALLFGTFLGRLLHFPPLILWVTLVAYLAHHLFHANRLLCWLRGGRANELPKGAGIWEEIYYLIFRLRRRNRRRKKQLIRMLERFRTATGALPDATVVLSTDDQIDWFNEAAGQLLGLRRSDIGQKIGNLIRFPKFVQYLSAGNYSTTVGIPSPISENTQLDIRIVLYGDDLRLLVAQDVTQLRFMERVRTDFVANVSHELRTPLTVIRGYVETLSDNAEGLPASYARIFQRMEEQTIRMQNLIDGLLSLTRLESDSYQITQQLVDVPAMLSAICEETRLLATESRPSLELKIETRACLAGGEQELRSAFSNLIFNAIKYCHQDDRVIVRWANQDDGARLDVEDTGPGIAPEYLPRLTERFYRVDAGRGPGGFGLGLAIVKHVMARHGAEFKISSMPGKGSCFSCIFPKVRVAEPRKSLPDLDLQD